MRIAAALIPLAFLAGCATVPAGERRESDYDRLARECRERGGVLLAGFGPLTGRPETDNYCELRGGGGGPRRR